METIIYIYVHVCIIHVQYSIIHESYVYTYIHSFHVQTRAMYIRIYIALVLTCIYSCVCNLVMSAGLHMCIYIILVTAIMGAVTIMLDVH